MLFNTICVCGAGTMGSGIAQLSASSGFRTILYEWNQEVLERARLGMSKTLQTLVEKNKLSTQEKEDTLQRLHFTNSISDCIADVMIEAIIEEPGAKIDLFNQLAALNSAQTIFATNTSSLSVSSLAKKIPYPARMIGMHFFNPAPVMKLVEIVRAEDTSTITVEAILDLARQFKKTPVLCNDSPGFIVNRVARPYYIESLWQAEKNAVDFALIDEMLEASGFKMGPFKLMDLIGNDINYAVSSSIYDQLGQPERLKPSVIQREKLEKGALGKKSGSGYYNYS